MDEKNVVQIGEGGFGRVLLLEDYNPPYVMKEVARGKDIDAQQKELLILKELTHKYIVKYLDQPSDFLYKGEHYPIFMEFCEHGSLRHVMKNFEINYSVLTIVKWAQEIFTALCYLKEQCIAHCDIKPENIFVNYDFICKVGDFGACKIFQERGKIEHSRIGTMEYMAPEVFSRSDLEEESWYKCDVYASGIVLLELCSRSRCPSQINAFHFSTTTDGTEKLKELINSCSSRKITIEKRFDAAKALKETESLEKLFTAYNAQPEINREQKRQKKPDGVIVSFEKQIELNTAEILPQDITGFTAFIEPSEPSSKSKTLVIDQHPITREEQLLNEYFQYEFLPKLLRNTNFQRLRIKKSAETDFSQCKSLVVGTYKGEYVDLNELRGNLAQYFCLTTNFAQLTIKKKPILLEEIHEFLVFFSKEQTGGDMDCTTYGNKEYHYPGYRYFNWTSKKDLLEPMKSHIKLLANLVALDFIVQDFCFRFAIHALWNCQMMTLSWVELIDFLNLAIHNIVEVGKVFTRRRQYCTYYLADSRTEWCGRYGLAFKRDLSEIRELTENEKLMWDQPTSKITLDIEAVRRALCEKKALIEKYAHLERKRGPKEVKPFESFFERLQQLLDKKYYKKRPLYAEDLIKYTLSDKTRRFWGYIYFWNRVPMNEEAAVCGCEIKCEIREFPESAPSSSMRIPYSLCERLDQKEFLVTHSLFEQAFRLLHFWPRAQYHRETFLYLVEGLLKEMSVRLDPSYGFFFVCVTELGWPKAENKKEQTRSHCHGPSWGANERTGLIVSLATPNKQAHFCSTAFRLENITTQCLVEYRGLLYIPLSNLQEMLLIMYNYLWFFEMEGIDVGSAPGLEEKRFDVYKEEMETFQKKFWTDAQFAQ